MSDFWGFAGADDLAILIVGGLAAACLISAWVFVRTY